MKKRSNKTLWIVIAVVIISIAVFLYIKVHQKTETICAKEGEQFSVVYKEQYPEKCCAELTEWNSGMDTRISIGSKCYETGALAGSPVGTCINCGDGICGNKENVCNCPQDCTNSSHSLYKSAQDFCAVAYNTFCAEEANHDSALCKLCSLV
jgi:hypothetical protein